MSVRALMFLSCIFWESTGHRAPTHYSPLNGLSPVVPLCAFCAFCGSCLMLGEFDEVAIGIVDEDIARAVVGAHARA